MTASKRTAICEQCPMLYMNVLCKECGCLIPLKVLIPISTCPKGKW